MKLHLIFSCIILVQFYIDVRIITLSSGPQLGEFLVIYFSRNNVRCLHLACNTLGTLCQAQFPSLIFHFEWKAIICETPKKMYVFSWYW
jgi:hypothetical protein